MKQKRLNDIIEDSVNDKLYLKKEDFEKRKYLQNTLPMMCFTDVNGNVYIHRSDVEPPKILKIKRTEEEKRRRSEMGDSDTRFGQGKYLDITDSEYSNNVSTFASDNYVWDKTHRVRELTPKESLLLMDVSEEDCDLIMKAAPKSQCRKMAAGAGVVNCLAEIFNSLIVNRKDNPVEPLW